MKKYLIFATLVAMVFVGCKKNTTAPPKPVDKRVVAKFSGNILKGDVTTTTITRVSERGEWEAKDQIGVFMFANEKERNADNVLKSNVLHKYTSTVSLTTADGAKTVNNAVFEPAFEDAIYFPAKTKVDFVAYFPYIKDMSPTAKTIKADFSNPDKMALETEGFYWAEAIGQSEESPKVTFTFKRAHGAMTLELSSETEDVKAMDLEDAKFTLIGVPTIGSFDIMTGKIFFRTDVTQPKEVEFTQRRINLPPHTNEKYGDRRIEISFSANPRVYHVPLKVDIEAGMNHRIAVKFQDDIRASVETSIVKWDLESVPRINVPMEINKE